MLRRLFGSRDKAGHAEREELSSGLSKSRGGLLAALGALVSPVDITEETWDDLEALLIRADVGARTASELVDDVRRLARNTGARRGEDLPPLLRRAMLRALEDSPEADGTSLGAGGVTSRLGGDRISGSSSVDRAGEPDRQDDRREHEGPWVVLMVGVNGGGKTTTAAKLAALASNAGRTVLLVAADTFRAAAIEQLAEWAERAGVPVVAGAPGGDPGAIVHDALGSAAGRAADVVIVDTAGRLQNQTNLMRELSKVARVAGRACPGAPHEVLLVLDATTGQNGLSQGRRFSEAVDIDGLVLSKLDSSAKGGVAFAIVRELGIPIRWVGVGEGLADIVPFDPTAYVDGLLGLSDSVSPPEC